MNRRGVLPLVAALSIATTSACAYHVPQPKVHFGLNTFTADVLYGATPSAILPGALPLRMPSTAQSPSAEAVPTGAPVSTDHVKVPPAPGCPAASSRAVAEPTVTRVNAPPAEATYPFRSTLQFTAGTTSTGKFNLPETREVSDVVTAGDTYDFTVTSKYPTIGLSEAISYQVVTSSAVPADQENDVPVGALSGVNVTSQTVTSTSNGKTSTSTVTWSPPIQILKLPATVGTNWAVSSIDQKSGATESYKGTVQSITEANACGTLVQGYQVELVGALVTPGQAVPVTFDETVLLAPQFGALVLADTATVTSASSPPATQTQEITDTIDVTPKRPASGAA
jgi:hypothetical protein